MYNESIFKDYKDFKSTFWIIILGSLLCWVYSMKIIAFKSQYFTFKHIYFWRKYVDIKISKRHEKNERIITHTNNVYFPMVFHFTGYGGIVVSFVILLSVIWLAAGYCRLLAIRCTCGHGTPAEFSLHFLLYCLGNKQNSRNVGYRATLMFTFWSCLNSPSPRFQRSSI